MTLIVPQMPERIDAARAGAEAAGGSPRAVEIAMFLAAMPSARPASMQRFARHLAPVTVQARSGYFDPVFTACAPIKAGDTVVWKQGQIQNFVIVRHVSEHEPLAVVMALLTQDGRSWFELIDVPLVDLYPLATDAEAEEAQRRILARPRRRLSTLSAPPSSVFPAYRNTT